MSSTQLRQYIDILKEDDFSTFSNFGFGNDAAPKTKSPKTATSPATTPKPAATEPDAETPADKEQPGDDVTAIQQALVDAGFELPRFGVDGKMGPETQAAIKAAEMVMGRKPTGTITVKEIEVIKNKGAAADNNSLASALGAIEAVLAKYKIKTESIEEQIDAYILKNINEYSQQEQLEIWRTLTEADTSDIPAYMRKGTDQFAKPNPNKLSGTVATATPAEKTRMQWDPQTKNYYSVDSKGAKTYQGVLTPKQSKLAKFAGKLGGAKGIGKKLVARAGATALSGPAALVVGTGLAAWTAWDIGKALYDTFASTEIEDLDPADQKVITDNLKTVMAYEQDPKMMATLPNELQLRVSNVAKGLNALAVDVGAVTPTSTTPAEKSPAPATKTEPNTTDVVKPFKDSGDGATYSTIAVKSSENNPNVKIYLGKRDGKSGTSYAIYAVDLSSGQGVAIKSGFRTDSDDLSTAQSQFAIKDIPLGQRYELSPGSTQYQRYQLLKDKFASQQPPATKTEPKTSTYKGYAIAGEPVVPGQPLSQTQIAVMQLSINSGNTYPPEVMAQYNKQKSSS